MAELPLYNKILILLIDFVGIWLAFIVYTNNRKGRLNKIFFGMIASMFAWVNFAYLAHLIGESQPRLTLMFVKIAWLATPVLFILLYFLVINYLGDEKKYKNLSLVVLFGGVVLSLLAPFTDLIIKDIEFSGVDLIINYGSGMFPFLGAILFLMCVPLYLLVKKYVKLEKTERVKIEYLLVGILIFYIANAIFNIIFPIFLGVVYLYWLGDYSSIVLLGFVAYAIVKRELFDIKVVLTTLLVGAMTILLGLDILVFTSDFIIKLYKGLVFVVFLYFGYLLIRSVLREIEMREKVKRAYEIEKRARKEIEQITEAKTQFIMATQHHLRTPLTSMIGYLDLVFGGTYGKVPVKLKEVLKKFQVSTKRLIRVVNELLDISQFQMGKEVVTLVPNTDVEPIIKEVLEELQFEVKMRGLYLKYNKVGRVPTVKADSEKLKVALFNIVDNAIKYTKKGGIIITLQKAKDGVQISIKDTGIGLDPAKAKKLFDSAFVRGKEAKKVHGFGRGIGIYITGHIIRAHKGKIWAESEGKGKGTTFFIELSK